MLKLTKSIGFFVIVCILGLALVPTPSYHPSYSHILYSKDGELLSASVSEEGQWCFSIEEDIPEKLQQSIILYEDAYYYYHLGVNPVSVIKAILLNSKSSKIKRGGSTIPMQVMRMKNKNVNRSYRNKMIEMAAAIKYSIYNSKECILKDWASIAPFGGNIIGVKAASLLYFGRELNNLSWSEYALLAVMPNTPSSMHLNKNRNGLLKKRNALLIKLNKAGNIPDDDLGIFLDEDLPESLHTLPQKAFHFMEFMKKRHPSNVVMHSTLSYQLQNKLELLLKQNANYLQKEDIQNIAAVVIDIRTNEVVAYAGNVRSKDNDFRYVDIAQAPRSYGSLLKPLLYNHAIEKGFLTPYELVADIPTEISGFRPQNFDKKYRGVVPFNEVLVKSLNVPAVRVLNTIGLDGFYDQVSELNLDYLNKGKDHYGLSLILGGAESSLWEMCRLYKGFAQNIANQTHPYREIKTLVNKDVNIKSASHYSPLSLYYMAEAMTSLVRPRAERSWDRFESQRNIAWKTGTSYGHKDAWSIGFNTNYAVGIWVGNENAEGRFNLTGVTKAAPIMFEIFDNLSASTTWFPDPTHSQKGHRLDVCGASGKLIGPLCNDMYTVTLPNMSHNLKNCNHHSRLASPINNQANGMDISNQSFDTSNFTLPPTQEYYYRQRNPGFKTLRSNDRNNAENKLNFKIIYPYNNLRIFLPKDNSTRQNQLILKGFNRDNQSQLFWFIDDTFTGSTTSIHELIIHPKPGHHTLTVVNEEGQREKIHFEIIQKESGPSN